MKDISIELSVVDEEYGKKHETILKLSYPLAGCFNGEYMNIEKAKKDTLSVYMYSASWNYKSESAKESINKLTHHKVRTAALIDNNTDAEIHCLGFGW